MWSNWATVALLCPSNSRQLNAWFNRYGVTRPFCVVVLPLSFGRLSVLFCILAPKVVWKLKRGNSSLQVLFSPFASISSRADYFHCFQILCCLFGASESPFIFSSLGFACFIMCRVFACLDAPFHVLFANGSQRDIQFLLDSIKYWSFPWTKQTPVCCLSAVDMPMYNGTYFILIYPSCAATYPQASWDENRCRIFQYTQANLGP